MGAVALIALIAGFVTFGGGNMGQSIHNGAKNTFQDGSQDHVLE